MALGYGGQYIIVEPDQNLVVAFVSSLPGERTDEPEELFNDYVLPAVTSKDPLPPNPDQHERLSSLIATVRSGPESVTPAMPATAQNIDGARYELQPNDMGFSSLEIQFADHSAIIELETDGQTFPFEVATNGRFVINEIPGELSMALRGAWESDDSFVIEYHSIGEIERGTWKLTFDDDSLRGALAYANETVQQLTGDRIN